MADAVVGGGSIIIGKTWAVILLFTRLSDRGLLHESQSA